MNVNELLCEEREKEKGGQIRRNKREIYIYINVHKERWNGEESEIFSSKTNLYFFFFFFRTTMNKIEDKEYDFSMKIDITKERMMIE